MENYISPERQKQEFTSNPATKNPTPNGLLPYTCVQICISVHDHRTKKQCVVLVKLLA